MLVLAVPESEAASPRCVILGHFGSAVAGYTALAMMGPGDVTSAVAIGMALFVMISTRTLHPPAGMDAFLIGLNGPARVLDHKPSSKRRDHSRCLFAILAVAGT